MGRIQEIAKLMLSQKIDRNTFVVKPRIITPKKTTLTKRQMKERLIANLSAVGVSHVYIASIFKISSKTVSRIATKMLTKKLD